jgi:hypothetical protein
VLGRRWLSLLLLALVAVVWPSRASAWTSANAQTRVGVFDVAAHAVVGLASARSPGNHRASSLARSQLASDNALAAEGASSSSYVYQLVDHGGDAVYYGLTNNPAVRLAQHAALPPGPFAGMQVISEALPLPQAQALETSLIQGAGAQGRLIYNIAETSVPKVAPFLEVPPTVSPLQTLLNPRLYPR